MGVTKALDFLEWLAYISGNNLDDFVPTAARCNSCEAVEVFWTE